MADLLHEYWENSRGGEFGSVREELDRMRPTLLPDARYVFSLRAPSWNEAMRLYHERLDYAEYVPDEALPNRDYTEEEAAEQQAYLAVRTVR
jgi:hypothetical protein